ncbi:hypothetical protein [Micromonospora haikouensis]|uniref:hypothetical protein n=1 Tax=Micromonospora haikouensis TaxID=686309 RepID=UPI003D735F5D
MANKMLGKVVAGAALGGASLLVFTPGIAFADGHYDGETRDGKVYAKPHVVKPGEKVKILEICPEAQEHAAVWSEVTGKVKLHPAEEDHGYRGEEDGAWAEEKAGEEHGEAKEDEKAGEEHGKAKEDDKAKEDEKAKGGKGGGAADDSSGEWSGYEHDQEAEKGYGHKSEKKSEKDWSSEDSGYGKDKSYSEDKGYGEDSSYGEDSGYGEDKGYGEEKSWEHKKDFVYYGEAEVAEDAAPGRYELKGSCAEGELVVLPRGHVEGGDGGAAGGTDRGLATTGASMMGAAALGGIVLMRRRRANGSLA